jgi:Tfp pilus assembly protein PilX
MKRSAHRIRRKQEAGVALLLSIFVLLAISVVAIAMIIASGTESALAGNYRTSTSAYYAATGGLEEARSRMLPKNPNYFGAAFMPPIGTTLLPSQVRYILNPVTGEVVAPLTPANPATYPDSEYALEFGAAPLAANTQTITSTAALALAAANVTPSLYKWVRITAATEKSLGDHPAGVPSVGRNVNGDAVIDPATPLYYDSALTPPRLIVSAAPPETAQQVFQITALAVLPNRTEKLLQYTVAAQTFNLKFPSALTIGANSVTFNGANSAQYAINGQDGSNPSAPAVPGCTANPLTVKNAIGTTNAGDVAAIQAGIPSNRLGNYTGATGTTPDVGTVSIANSLDTPLDAYNTVQAITNSADLVINGNANQGQMPAAMSASNPMTVVVDGDFSMTGNFTGYGLLVVTGNFSYSGTTGWNGIVLVVGDGTTTYNGSGGGNNSFNGAIYVATIWDAQRNLLNTFGPVQYDISGGGGSGTYYDSCWIKNAQQPISYQILSFREIPYND